MSKNLYNEAIAEAKLLREMAEQNAKNKIIEAVTPRIRSLIEQQLIDDVEEESELVIGGDEDEGLDSDNELDVAIEELPMPAPEPAAPAVAPTVSITVQGDLEMELGESESEEEDLILSQESFLRLENFLTDVSKTKKFSERVVSLSKRFNLLREAIDGVNLNRCTSIEKQTAIIFYGRLLEEVINLSNNLILMKESIDNRLELQLTQLIKEMSKMSRRRDAAAFRRLFEELTKDEGLEEVGMYEQEEEVEVAEEEVEVEEEVAVEPDLPAAEDALMDLGTALGLDVEVEPAEEEVDLEVEEEEEITLESDDSDEGDIDEVYEIDEASLRRELFKMRKLREQEEGRAAAADPALAHGGEDEGDVIIDVDEDALLNALADELGDPGVPAPQVEAFVRRRLRRASRQLAESQRRSKRTSRRRSNRRISESRRRNTASGSRRALIAERTVTKLKKQLAEMNLFNAKLLFANKLMQNRGLSTKQQRVVVEALDKARTIREAKLLYKSLSASLNRGSGKTLSESRSRLLASSSKSTRSGSPANNGNEVDRWAILAGLTSDK